MKKMSVTLKAAWVSSIALVISALVTGAFTLLPDTTPEANEKDFTSLLVDIPPGSKVTILVESTSKEETRKFEAIFEKEVKEQSMLKLVEPTRIKEIMSRSPTEGHSAVDDRKLNGLEHYVEYIVLLNADSSYVRVMDVKTGQILYSRIL